MAISMLGGTMLHLTVNDIKYTDQSACPFSLIVIHYLDNKIPLIAISKLQDSR